MEVARANKKTATFKGDKFAERGLCEDVRIIVFISI